MTPSLNLHASPAKSSPLTLELLVVWPLQCPQSCLYSISDRQSYLTVHAHTHEAVSLSLSLPLRSLSPSSLQIPFFFPLPSLFLFLFLCLSLSLSLFFLHLILSAPSCGEADKELIYHPIKCRHWNIASKKKKKKACRFHPSLIGLPLACACVRICVSAVACVHLSFCVCLLLYSVPADSDWGCSPL